MSLVTNIELKARDINLNDLENEPDLYKRLKGHIIICRRKNNYHKPFVESNFSAFKKLVRENIEEIIKNLNARWLLSLLECYIDCGTPEEQAGALAISTLINWERYKFVTQNYTPGNWCDGITVMGSGSTIDAPHNLFKRIHSTLTRDTKPLAVEIIKRLFTKPDFTLNQLEHKVERAIKKDVYDRLLMDTD